MLRDTHTQICDKFKQTEPKVQKKKNASRKDYPNILRGETKEITADLITKRQHAHFIPSCNVTISFDEKQSISATSVNKVL